MIDWRDPWVPVLSFVVGYVGTTVVVKLYQALKGTKGGNRWR